MKNIPFLLVIVLMLSACSAPRYSYHFDHYDYNSGKKKITEKNPVAEAGTVETQTIPNIIAPSPLVLEKESVAASTKKAITAPVKESTTVLDKTAFEKKYKEMTKSERKDFRKALKTEIRNYSKSKKSGDNGAVVNDTKAMDYNLKMAIIFGAIAATLSFFGGVNSVFWILSVVFLVVGVVFFIKWIAEQ